jgi:Cu/Ag efflux pump CusA
MFYTTLILLLAVSPILFVEGSFGAFFRPMAVSYGLAILASLLVALTVVPALSLILLPNGQVERRVSPLAGWFRRLYEPVLARVIRRGRLASHCRWCPHSGRCRDLVLPQLVLTLVQGAQFAD